MRTFNIICLILVVLSLLCCKKSTKPDDGLPHYWPRYIDMEPAWSPDGNTIAYNHGGIDEQGDTNGIYLINVDGTNNRLFYRSTKVYAPDFSPDSNWLAFSDYAQVFKIKLNGDSLTQLTFEGRNFFPDWSPDGKRIAFDVTEPIDSGGIYMMQENGAFPHLVSGGFGGRFPDFSPDGRKILCVIPYNNAGHVENYFWILSLENSNHVRLPLIKGDNRYPVFFPDGKRIAFSSAYNSAPVIYVMDSDGQNIKMLTPEGGDNPAWSPDGKYIAYTYVHPDYGRIFIMNADGTGKRQLTFKKSSKK